MDFVAASKDLHVVYMVLSSQIQSEFSIESVL